MSSFYSKYNDIMRESSLTRVRLKYLDNYEGYILEEIGEEAVVYIAQKPTGKNSGPLPGQLYRMDMNNQRNMKPASCSSPLDRVKIKALKHLKQKGLISKQDPIKIQQILQSPCIHSVENCLRKMNVTDSELLSITKAGII